MMSQITENIFVGGLGDAIRVANDVQFDILCVLEYRPKLEPKKAYLIPAVRLVRDHTTGEEMTYAQIVCPVHGSWYEHTPEQLLEDRKSVKPGVYDTGSNPNFQVQVHLENLLRIRDFLKVSRRKTLIQCLSGMERSPLVAADYLAWEWYNGDLELAYRYVKGKHPDTIPRIEWFENTWRAKR